MTGLPFVGPDLILDEDLSHKSYVDSLQGSDFTIPQIDAAAAAGLTSYATKTYVDGKDAQNATKSYVDGKDAQRIPLTQKNIANGVVGLGASGKAPNSLINEPASEIIIRGPWSPAALGSVADSVVAESTLFTCGITDPGYAYKPVIFGEIDCSTYSAPVRPEVIVRQGNETTGQIVARGIGDQEIWSSSFDDFNRADNPDLGQYWVYGSSDGTRGRIGVKNNAMSWVDTAGTGNKNYGYAQRVKADEFNPAGDYCRITFTVSSIDVANINNGQFFDIFARVDGTSLATYTNCRFIQGNVQFGWVSNNSAMTQMGPTTPLVLTAGSTYDVWFGVPPSAPRRFLVFKDDVPVLDFTESAPNSILAPSARGWGVGMKSNNGISGAAIDNVRMRDTLVSTLDGASQVSVIPVNLQSVTSITGATTLYVKLNRPGTTGMVRSSTFDRSLYVQAVPV